MKRVSDAYRQALKRSYKDVLAEAVKARTQAEDELNRCRAMIQSLRRECEILHAQLKEHDAGIGELHQLVDRIMGVAALQSGKADENGVYTLTVPVDAFQRDDLLVTAYKDDDGDLYVVKAERKKENAE